MTISYAKFAARFSRGLLYLFMIALVGFTALPIIYMVSTAFKPLDELFLYPPRFLVHRPTMRNFFDLLTATDSSVVPFSRYIFNSVFVSSAIVGISLVVCSLGAYVLSKLKPRGSGFIFAVILSALMFAPQVTQIPTYLIVSGLGLVNTYWALILPKVAVAFNIFLMKQFFDQIPDALIEAAHIDGASEWTIFWRVIMAVSKPAWATLIIFSFIGNWNDYFSALVFTTSETMKTLPLAIQTLAGGPGVVARSGALAAGTFLITLPPIVIFLLFQKLVMNTMVYSGIKS
ncbi:carbohydrate ABC transporter permease [Paenibacillus sp. OV219]|uniref:carbohydrate ABC transporter permease n=1 Tax=Paenibacillus sp. OV219 TaxID=1884377 RepID=UPI0008B4BE78|nr:carbohydrate ABC transporter permease [Paenibacillus sp. OV219]SEM60550.1 carbohydrate ABC transporter membrane protein 2, CUT1 family [Paenibacillus sp. OV219]